MGQPAEDSRWCWPVTQTDLGSRSGRAAAPWGLLGGQGLWGPLFGAWAVPSIFVSTLTYFKCLLSKTLYRQKTEERKAQSQKSPTIISLFKKL